MGRLGNREDRWAGTVRQGSMNRSLLCCFCTPKWRELGPCSRWVGRGRGSWYNILWLPLPMLLIRAMTRHSRGGAEVGALGVGCRRAWCWRGECA